MHMSCTNVHMYTCGLERVVVVIGGRAMGGGSLLMSLGWPRGEGETS